MARQTTKKTKGGRQPSKPNKVNYSEIANKVSRMALAKINPSIKNAAGNNTTLGNLGMLAGNGISKIFGLGAYKMKTNSLYDTQTGSQVPFMHSTDESVRFRHREYIGDIVSTTGFTSNIFSINPGLEKTFPYLSSIASNFQEYKFKGLIFEYKSTSSTVVTGANTAMGTVSMVAQYRSDAPDITSKLQLLNEMWSADARPSDTFILPVECDPAENPMHMQYVRTGTLPANQDIKMYDLAKVAVATQGQQTAGTVIGELWISYEVELYKPIMANPGNSLFDNTAKYSRLGCTSALPLGTTSISIIDTFGLSFTGTTIALPAGTLGTYYVNVTWANTVVTVTAPTVAVTNGVISSTGVAFTPNNGTVTDELACQFIFTCTGDSVDDVPLVTFGGAGTIPLAVSLVFVTQVPTGTI